MRKTFICGLLAFLSALQIVAQKIPAVQDNRYNSVSFQALPSLDAGDSLGVAAPFSGKLGNYVLVAGGCNFPDVPAAEGGQKKFYDEIYLYDGHSWKSYGHLPRAMAYGVGVSVSDGVVCIGGTDGTACFSDVYKLRLRDGKVEMETLPSLPVPFDNMAGAYDGKYIYVAAGETNGTPTNAMYRLRYPGGRDWERMPDFPGATRMQPAGVVQNGANGPCFYLMGGYKVGHFAPGEEDEMAMVHHDGLVYDPRTNEWSATSPILPVSNQLPMTLVGATGVASGCNHIIFFGGVNAQIFLQALNRPLFIKDAMRKGNTALQAKLEQEEAMYMKHPAEWYRFNGDLLIYHTLTDTWTVEARSERIARAGAAVVPYDGRWMVINGESKPGVRSTDVTTVKMGRRTNFGWINWSVLAIYLAGMLFLGYYFMRREGSSDDFFKGGGRIPWWAAGISIYATMLSAITYMAIPAKAYTTDWTYYPMLIMILVVSFPVIKYYLPFFRRLNVTSAYEYLEQRFNYATRLMASALFIVFMIARMALVIYLPSLALTTVTGIDIYMCIVLMSIITIVYCTMGGVEAVVWGDVIQGIILVGGALFAMFYLAFNTEGGIYGFFDLASQNDKFRLFDWSFDYTKATFWVVILGGLANNLISYTSDQTVIQRYLTTKDERSAGRSILMNGLMSAFISVAFYAIGTGLYTFFKTHPAELDYTMANTDTIFPFFMMSQMPVGVAGLLIAAIFAATMSTISSNINSVSTAFTIDIYRKWRPLASDKSMLVVARRTCAVSGLIGMGLALLMATWNILSLLDYFNTILGLLSSGLGGLFIMGIFFPRIGARAALIGFIAGTAVVFYLNYCTPMSFLLFGFIGMLVSVLVALFISLFGREKREQPGLTWKTLND